MKNALVLAGLALCAALSLGLTGCSASNDKTAVSGAPPGVATAPPPSQSDYMQRAQQGASGGNNPYGAAKKGGS